MANKKDFFCFKCGKKIAEGEKTEVVIHNSRFYQNVDHYCLPCWEIKKQKDKEAKEKREERDRLNEERREKTRNEREEQNKEKAKVNFEKLSTECFQETFQLGIKKQSQGLNRSDYKKIANLEKRLASAAKNQYLADPSIQKEIANLQGLFQDLRNKNNQDNPNLNNNSNGSNNNNQEESNNPSRERERESKISNRNHNYNLKSPI